MSPIEAQQAAALARARAERAKTPAHTRTGSQAELDALARRSIPEGWTPIPDGKDQRGRPVYRFEHADRYPVRASSGAPLRLAVERLRPWRERCERITAAHQRLKGTPPPASLLLPWDGPDDTPRRRFGPLPPANRLLPSTY